MTESRKKTLITALIICITGGIVLAAEEQISKDLFQPQALENSGVYGLRQIDPNLTGLGVKFALICRSITYIDGEPQNDYRPDTEHNCLKSAQINFHDQADQPTGVSSHSTAICSILFGEDSNASEQQLGQFYYQGAAPQAEADIYEFWHFLTNNVFAGTPPEADILTADIGNQFEDWWTRGIESMAEHYGLIVVAGIGNGSDAYDPPLYPGAARNVIGVGVVDAVNTENLPASLANFSLAYPEHSTFGPTEDGRCKPDIVAPGNCLAAGEGEQNLYEPTGNWSSFSTPIVAGAIGLLVQKAKQDQNLSPALSPDGGNCVIKAILLNSATKLPYWHKGRLGKDDDHYVPLDYIQGTGMLNAVEAYKNLIARQDKQAGYSSTGWDLNQLQKSGNLQNIYRVSVTEPVDKFITTTLVWNKHFDSNYPFEPKPEKDDNLRLELWAVDTNDPNNDYLLDYSDSNDDNTEHIYCQADANYTEYEIIVTYNDANALVQSDTVQRYGLAWRAGEKQDSNNIFWYDLNADGIVNEMDFNILLNNLRTGDKSPDRYILGDINTDGKVDANDFQIFLGHINRKADWR